MSEEFSGKKLKIKEECFGSIPFVDHIKRVLLEETSEIYGFDGIGLLVYTCARTHIYINTFDGGWIDVEF